MAFQKFRADQLFDGYRMLDSNWVLVTTDDGIIMDVVNVSDAGADVRVFEGILSPGFINCHCHLELSHMKGLIPENTGLIQFVSHVMRDRNLVEEVILQAITDAETEMINSGIVAVGDIVNNKLTLGQKRKGQVYYHNFIEATGFSPQSATARFERAVELFAAYAPYYSVPVASCSIVPHAPYSVSRELLEKITRYPGNQLLTIHNQETQEENTLFENRTGEFLSFYENFRIDASLFEASGRSSLQTFIPAFLSNQQLILVHNLFTSRADLEFCRQASIKPRLHWCLCPNANLYISGNLPNLELFTDYDCTMVLGTDSLASNQQLSILAEMRTIQQHFPFVKSEKLFEWATLNGARALQMEHILGSFEKGKKPGIVLCDKALTRSRRLL